MANEPKIAGILSAIASGIAIIIYLTGKTSIPDFFVGTKLTRQLEERPFISAVNTESPSLDTAAIREIVAEEIAKKDTLIPPVPGGIVTPPQRDSIQPPRKGECDLNGRVFGSTYYLHFFDKKGNNYKFNGFLYEGISGTAIISGTTIILKGKNCNGEVTLFNDCSLLEGRITVDIFERHFREFVQKELVTE